MSLKIVSDSEEFHQWLLESGPKDKALYHTGVLCIARGDIFSREETRKRINQLARHVWKAASEGKVYLVQRRPSKEEFSFEYLAIKASPPHRPWLQDKPPIERDSIMLTSADRNHREFLSTMGMAL